MTTDEQRRLYRQLEENSNQIEKLKTEREKIWDSLNRTLMVSPPKKDDEYYGPYGVGKSQPYS